MGGAHFTFQIPRELSSPDGRRDPDEPSPPRLRLDRGGHRTDVLGQVRGADPAAPSGGDRAPAGRRSSSRRSTTGSTRGDVVSHSQWRHPVRGRGAGRRDHWPVSTRAPRSSGSTRRQFFDDALPTGLQPSRQPRQAGHRGRPRHGLPRRPVRPDARRFSPSRRRCTRSTPSAPAVARPAAYTQRLTESEEQVVVGAPDIYEARCRRCHEPEGAVAGSGASGCSHPPPYREKS